MQGSTALTPKGEQTRQRILDTALKLFVEKGFDQTTLRDIAAAADCSLGLTYRYFERKEDLVLALYQRLARDLEEQVKTLPSGTIAERFVQAMRIKIHQSQPYRDALGALFGAALTPNSDIAVLGERTSDIRDWVSNTFLTVVMGATDAPRERQAREIAMVLYVGHLALMLYWLHDRTPGQQATEDMLKFAQETLTTVRRVLRLPPVGRVLSRFAAAVAPVFGRGVL